MRKLAIMFMSASCLVLWIGCEEELGVGGVSDVVLDSTRANQCSGSFDTCSFTFYVSFQDNADYEEHYYWAALEGVSTHPDEAIGGPVKLTSNGEAMEVSVTGHYFELSPDFYELWVYRCDNPADAGDARKRTGAGNLPDSNLPVGEFGSDCQECFCSGNPRDRWHCTAVKEVFGGATGVKSRIKTRYGQHCGGPNGSVSSSQSAWVGLTVFQLYDTANQAWGQVGYTHQRIYGTTETDTVLYLEHKPPGAPFAEFVEIPDVEHPMEGIFRDYECAFNPSLGDWYFLYEGDTESPR